MTNPKLNYEHIVVDVEGIYLDGYKIDAYKVSTNPIVQHLDLEADVVGPSITLTIHADRVTVSDRVKALPEGDTGHVIERGTEAPTE